MIIKCFSFQYVEAACKPSPCGENTKCEVINEIPVCTCLSGYKGSPLTGCRHECENDHECPNHLACSSLFKCESPCKCGTNANCNVVNHLAKCTCPHVSLLIIEIIIIILIIIYIFYGFIELVRKSISFLPSRMYYSF